MYKIKDEGDEGRDRNTGKAKNNNNKKYQEKKVMKDGEEHREVRKQKKD